MPKVYGTMGSGEYGPIPSGSKGNGEMGPIPTDESVPNVIRGSGANMTKNVVGPTKGQVFGTRGGVQNETVDGFTSGKTEKPPEKPQYR